MIKNCSRTADSIRTVHLKRLILLGGLSMMITTLATGWWVTRHLYANEFDPVQLSIPEQQVLEAKMAPLLQKAGAGSSIPRSSLPDIVDSLEPAKYTETGADREIQFTEREINALIAEDPEIARHLAVDLADDLLSVNWNMPVDQEMPLIGGKLLKLDFGLALSYLHGKPVVAMRGMSIGGIPLPRAWWGDIQNMNLVEEFGGQGGFWDQFAKGIDDLKIQDGQLYVRLKE